VRLRVLGGEVGEMYLHTDEENAKARQAGLGIGGGKIGEGVLKKNLSILKSPVVSSVASFSSRATTVGITSPVEIGGEIV
jgi:hypothetical protein